MGLALGIGEPRTATEMAGELVGRMVNSFRLMRQYAPDGRSVTIAIVLKEE